MATAVHINIIGGGSDRQLVHGDLTWWRMAVGRFPTTRATVNCMPIVITLLRPSPINHHRFRTTQSVRHRGIIIPLTSVHKSSVMFVMIESENNNGPKSFWSTKGVNVAERMRHYTISIKRRTRGKNVYMKMTRLNVILVESRPVKAM